MPVDQDRKKTNMRGKLASTLLAAGIALAPAAHAQNLRIGMTAVAKSIDPHFYNVLYEKALMLHLYDRLVEQTPDTRLAPGLALSWRAISDTVWEFKLRPGVVWQDGVPFSADDIIFTYDRVRHIPNATGGFDSYVAAIAALEVIDPQTLRVTTKRPEPNLPGDLANVAIVSRHAGTGATTEDYNSLKAAIGTGPYRIVKHDRGDGMVLERNENWWGPKPDWARVTLKAIPLPGSRSAALLSGDVDLIDFPASSDIARFKADKAIRVAEELGTRTLFLAPNVGADANVPFLTDNDGKPLPHNPLRDIRVRQAISLALNRDALADRVLSNTVKPTGQFLNPGMYSYSADIGVPRYNPGAAKKLLAEAGYPDGFRIVLHGETTKSEVIQAMAQMLSRAGFHAIAETVPPAAFLGRAAHQDFALSFNSWASNSGEAGYGLSKVFASVGSAPGRGSANFGHYNNPGLDREITDALNTIDDTARELKLIHATHVAFADLGVVPVYQEINTWASRAGVLYAPRADGRTVAMSATVSDTADPVKPPK